MSEQLRYLLVLGCSQRKRPDAGRLPALERYDGVNYRVLRKLERERGLPGNLDIVILSAKYGLIAGSTGIEDYDLRLTPDRAAALSSIVAQRLDEQVCSANYLQIFINLGKDYMPALAGCISLSRAELQLIYARGGIGEKMAQMKEWLYALGN